MRHYKESTKSKSVQEPSPSLRLVSSSSLQKQELPIRPTRHYKFLNSTLCWYLALMFAANVMALLLEQQLQQERSKNLMTDSISTSTSVTFDHSVGENLSKFWGKIPDATSNRLVILEGMSQTYAINEMQPGDLSIPDLLQNALKKHGIATFGLVAPNLSNEEALFLFLSTLADEKTKPRAVIFGACFDKFRNIDLRQGYLNFMSSNPKTSEIWRQVAESYRTTYPDASSKMLRTLATSKTSTPSNDSTESKIKDGLAKLFPLFRARAEIQAESLNLLYLLRNQIFQIKTSSKRPMMASRYQMNKNFIEIMIQEAQHHGVRLILYINPLNPQAENPYVDSEYSEFKRWIESTANAKGLPFANFEDIVPVEHWGTWLDGPDFKHFKAEGHKILSSALVSRFAPVFDSISKEQTP